MSADTQKIPEYAPAGLDDHRFELPASLSIAWLNEKPDAALVPLHWRRPLRLPPAMLLEAWYLTDLSAHEEWTIDPHAVSAGSSALSLTADELAEARSLVVPTQITFHKERWRIRVPKLLSYFASQAEYPSRPKIMVSLENASAAVWTFRAFQAHLGSIGT
jgi:hypothetical protein